MQAPTEATRKKWRNWYRSQRMAAQTNHIKKPCNNRQLARLKSWHNVVQENQIEQLWFDLEGASDTKNVRIML